MGTQEPPESGGAPAESDGVENEKKPRPTSDDPDGGAALGDPDGADSPHPFANGLFGLGVGTSAAEEPSEASRAGRRLLEGLVVGGPDASDAESTGSAAEGEVVGAAADPPRGGRPAEPGVAEHGRNLPPDEPAARFDADEKPSRYSTGIGQRQPTKPLDPIRPYLAPPVPRRRRADWQVMIFAMVVAGLVMVGCCVAGFALYSAYGNPFAR
jgi:hypothetical protein